MHLAHSLLLLLCANAALIAAEPWPGVKVTYFKGADCDEELLVTYERELRHDNWVPLPLRGEGKKRKPGLGPYSVRYEALLRVDTAGAYTFRPSSRRERSGYAIEIAGQTVAWTTYDREEVHHGKKKIVQRPISEPITLQAGLLPIRMTIRDPRGRGTRDGRSLHWQGPDFAMRPLSPARLSVEPWPQMRRRPMLRFAMVGHSNVEGRCGGTIRAPASKAQKAWYYSVHRRTWSAMSQKDWNHTSGLTAALSERYPDHFFGGMMLGKAASNVCDQWREGQVLYLTRLRALRNTMHCGPLIAMGSHFDWDEMKRQEFVDEFEACHADLIKRFRTDLEMPELPWIFTRVSPNFSGKPYDPGPGRGNERYQTLYRAADNICAALPPMGIVTTDDFINGQMGKKLGRPHDCGPEGDMHYTNLGFRKWTKRAMQHIDRMQAVEKAIARLDAKPEPYPQEVEVDPRWPVSGDPDQVVLVIRGEITRVTKPRPPKELGPYPNALMTVEYRILPPPVTKRRSVWTENDPYKPDRLVVALPSVIDRQVAPAASFKPGMRHIVFVASPEAQPAQVKELPVDDDIQELDLPVFHGLAVCDYSEEKFGKIFASFHSGNIAKLAEAIRFADKQE